VYGVAAHSLMPGPDIGLDVLHDVADVKVTVGVGERRGHENSAFCHLIVKKLLTYINCR
jgi:hypothetical protein